ATATVRFTRMLARCLSLAATAYSSVFPFLSCDTASTGIYTLSLHDALPISICTGSTAVGGWARGLRKHHVGDWQRQPHENPPHGDRKSTRLNSSHVAISYAVFCLKKKNNNLPYDEIVYRIDGPDFGQG